MILVSRALRRNKPKGRWEGGMRLAHPTARNIRSSNHFGNPSPFRFFGSPGPEEKGWKHRGNHHKFPWGKGLFKISRNFDTFFIKMVQGILNYLLHRLSAVLSRDGLDFVSNHCIKLYMDLLCSPLSICDQAGSAQKLPQCKKSKVRLGWICKPFTEVNESLFPVK